jgi:hypothetical protein
MPYLDTICACICRGLTHVGKSGFIAYATSNALKLMVTKEIARRLLGSGVEVFPVCSPPQCCATVVQQ